MPKIIGLTAARTALAVLCLGGSCGSALAQQSGGESGTAPAQEQSGAEPGPAGDSGEAGTAPADDSGNPAPAPTIPVKPSEEPPPSREAAQLEDVVVTATKREKSLREIPASIDEFRGEALENAGKWSLTDYIEEKPGVTIVSIGPNLIKVNVRGIATDNYPGSPLSTGTGILIGDTAFGDPFITNLQPDFAAFDLSSVELLKGPQGTLFGAAALAGAVRYVMQEPVLGEWQTRAFSQYDAPTDGTAVFSEGAAMNAPLGDTFAARLAYVKHNYPGITDNVRLGTKDVDGSVGNQYRGLVSWHPLEALDFKLTHLKQDSFTANVTPLVDSPNGPHQTSLKVLPQPSATDFGLDSLQASYDFGPVRATLLSSRTFKDWFVNVDITYVITGLPPPGVPFDPKNGWFQISNDNSKSTSHELRLQSTGQDGLQWLVGLFNVDYKVHFDILDDSVQNYDLNQQLGNDPATYHESSLFYGVTDVKAHERAGFFDVGYKFWDRLDLSAGARYYQTEVAGGFKGVGTDARAHNNGSDFDYSNHVIAEKGVNPKATATWEFTRDISTYLSASRGFRFGGLQSVPSSSDAEVPPQYKSDTLWNYELGTRTAWFGNTLHFDTSVFYVDWKNPQIALRTARSPAFAYIDNVGHAISRGFESSIVWLTPIDGVRLDLGGGMTDAHTTVPFQVPNVQSGSGTITVPAGAQMPGSAKSQYAAAINYVGPQLGIFGIGAHVDYYYVGKTYGDIIQAHHINDFGILNGGIMLTTTRWRLKPQLAVNCSNITNVTKPTFGAYSKPITSNAIDLWYVTPPRTYSARLGLEF